MGLYAPSIRALELEVDLPSDIRGAQSVRDSSETSVEC